MSENAISIRNVSKVYHLYPDAAARLKEILNPFSNRQTNRYHEDYYALSHVSLNIAHNGTTGIIGTNGAGKSTLLKIISGVLSPTEGTVSVEGKTAAILELGAGFHPEYTGRENIKLNALLSGYEKEEINEKTEAIIAFAQIGTFIDQPVKTYSSGMFARLAFAVSIHADPDILIVDEALSVGDVQFQQKCFRKMQEMKTNRTILLVTHDMGAILKFCDRAIWLERGKLIKDGKPAEVVKEYQRWLFRTRDASASSCEGKRDEEVSTVVTMQDNRLQQVYEAETVQDNGQRQVYEAKAVQDNGQRQVYETEAYRTTAYTTTAYTTTENTSSENDTEKHSDLHTGKDRIIVNADGRRFELRRVQPEWESYGNGDAHIEAIGFYQEENSEPVNVLRGGESVLFIMKVHKETVIENPIAGLTVTDRLGTNLFSLNSYLNGTSIHSKAEDDIVICRFVMPQLNEGHYCISPAYANGTQANHAMLHWVYDAWVFQVIVPFEKTLEGLLAVTDFSYRVLSIEKKKTSIAKDKDRRKRRH